MGAWGSDFFLKKDGCALGLLQAPKPNSRSGGSRVLARHRALKVDVLARPRNDRIVTRPGNEDVEAGTSC